MKLILGSKSSGRQQVLRQMGYDFDVVSADIDEKSIRHQDPSQLVLLLAHAKADALAERLGSQDAFLITSDQVVAFRGEIREKAASKEEAKEFLRSYSDNSVQTITSVLVTNLASGKRRDGVDVATVFWKNIPDEVIEAYVASERPFHLAGGFGVQDELIRDYVDHIEGEVESIMGLPKSLLKDLLLHE